MKARIVLEIEYETDAPNCTRKDIDEAIEHLREAHGCIVREETPTSLYEKAFAALERVRRIRALTQVDGES